MTVARDRLTNVRRDRRAAGPCPTCHGARALLPMPNGVVVSALFIVPNRRAWRGIPIAPCPACDQTGDEPRHRPRAWGEG